LDFKLEKGFQPRPPKPRKTPAKVAKKEQELPNQQKKFKDEDKDSCRMQSIAWQNIIREICLS
jgi:hypothetical protein